MTTKTPIMILAAALALIPLRGEYFRGMSYLYYDSPSETLYIHTGQLVDYSTAYYYWHGACATLRVSEAPPNAGQTVLLHKCLAASSLGGAPSVDIFATVPRVIGGRTYFLESDHELNAVYQYFVEHHDCYNNCTLGQWWDYFGYRFASQNPPEPTPETMAQPPLLMTTVTQAFTIAVYTRLHLPISPCGDPSMDPVHGEYRDPANNASFFPVCADFTTDRSTQHFSWGELNTSNDYTHGIFRDALLPGMECVRTQNGNTPLTVSSVYRNPARNRRVGGSPNSYHIHGRAVDFPSSGMQTFRNESQRIARACGGCREPTDSTPHHVHFDWRTSPCPAGW